VNTTRAGQTRRNKPDCPQRPRYVLCIKGTTNLTQTASGRGINISGVDFWHAVEFSRNGHFLCTHPLGLSSGRFPSVLRFQLYQTLSCPIPQLAGFRFPAFQLSGDSDFTRPFSVPFPVRNSIPVAVGKPVCLSACSLR
jgi:hypothetical protein